MRTQGELLAPDRALLFPSFETYKLHALDTADIASYALPGGGATQSRVGHDAHLSFREVRARIAHNHLDTRGRRGVYVDADWAVIGFELGDDLDVRFSTLASIPAPIGGVGEYPRALPLDDATWAVSSGSGSVYVLRVEEAKFSGQFVARYDLLSEGGTAPFLLVAGHAVGDGTFRLLLARAVVQGVQTGFKPRKAAFELAEVEITAAPNGVDDGPEQMTPRWTLTGTDLPYFATWADGGWVVLSEEPFTAGGGEEKEETEAERAERERKDKVGKLGLGATLKDEEGQTEMPQVPAGAGEASASMDVDDKAYPFRWTQDTASLTLTVPVPAGTARGDISLTLARESLSLTVSGTLSPQLAAFTAQKSHAFWADIAADDSTWTYDASAAEIEIDIQKAPGDGLRWPSVFVPADSDDENEDEDVPETFAPATLAAMRNSFSAVRRRSDDAEADGELPAANPSMPALLREEMDLDFDGEDDFDFAQRTDGAFADLGAGAVGRTVLIGYIADGTASWSRQPASVLSLPTDDEDESIIVKSAVDGLVFTPPADNPARTPWTHAGTNPALAFVMSSKRDLRLVRHVREPSGAGAGATVLAFESGSGTGNGNVYVYYPPAAGGSTNTARQGVLPVSGGARGALLGAGCVSAGGRRVAVALCERELVVLRRVLD